MTQPTPIRREPDGLPLIDLPGLDLLAHAVAAAGRGWHVFPLRPRDKRPAGHAAARCPGTGRCVAGHRTPEQRATTDPDLLAAAWTHAPYNIGVATGPSGLLVVDLDTLNEGEQEGTPDGVTSFEALCERAGAAVPTTYRVRTASGGMHLYFTQPDGARLGNTAGRLGKHIDTRGWGGYVVAPGSTVNGCAYEVIDSAPVAALPLWLLDALTSAPRPAVVPVPVSAPQHGGRVADIALQRETAAVAGATEGTRNQQLLQSTRAVGRFVAWGDLPRHVAEEAFQGAGEAAGLPAAECRATIRSALDWSIRTCRPREVA
ncbi:bifunctional DNA primase/polymerase [Streptomyces atratus]|uniref:bifunctional DNA primase/polymerase n=1 Tax=Streptomyces atratus TaxID=1893 RepID=UPI00225B9394|nr:bifunctional DNA primase/polymerase [Streptomyces atratus]MCX5340514.1 bifunctional DNA primase/polymerase [Streptomyces atratus]